MEWACDRAVNGIVTLRSVGIVTLRSTRLVQLPEREECVPSDAAGFAMLSLTPV
jgi:hypothetical protein